MNITNKKNGKFTENYRVRVGLLLHTLIQPRWLYDLLRNIQQDPKLKIVITIISPLHIGSKKRGLGRCLFSLYKRIDRRIFAVEEDPLAMCSLDKLVENVPQKTLDNVSYIENNFDVIGGIDKIRDLELDVILYFGEHCPGEKLNNLARNNIWMPVFNDAAKRSVSLPAFYGMKEGEHVLSNELIQISNTHAEDRLIDRSWTSNNNISLYLNQIKLYRKSANSIIRALHRIVITGLPYAAKYVIPVLMDRNKKSDKTIGELIKFFYRIISAMLMYKIRRKLFSDCWFIAFKINPKNRNLPTDFSEFHILKPPKDRVWADPFPWVYKDRYYIFFEEIIFKDKKHHLIALYENSKSKNRGHISVVEIYPDGQVSSTSVVLEKKHHLSFPFLFEYEGELYMIPETSTNNTIECYKCMHFPNDWAFHSVLMKNVRTADTVLKEIDGTWWMFTSISENKIGNNDDVFLFSSKNPFGKWHAHPENPIVSDVRYARQAGGIFKLNGRLYRPSQDSSKRYGFATNLQEIIQIDRQRYKERTAYKILPEWTKGVKTTHTLNSVNGLIVIDGSREKLKL